MEIATALMDDLRRMGIQVRSISPGDTLFSSHLQVLGLVRVNLDTESQFAAVERWTSPAKDTLECWPDRRLEHTAQIASDIREAIRKSIGHVEI